MLWLNLPALVGLAAIGVPVLIHLLGRRQARRQKFPTLRFLDASRLLPTRRTRLTDLWLLVVRAAIVAGAALALAQPRFSMASRAAALQNTVARAIIVDTSASMSRPSASAGGGARLVDDARATAKRLASAATESLIIEAATPARAVAGAVDWLRTQSGHATVVMVSDFQTGTVDSAVLAQVPPDVGIQLTPVVTRVDTGPPASPVITVHSGRLLTTARTRLTPERTAVEWTGASLGRDSSGGSVTLLAGVHERAAAEAAERAAMAVGGSWPSSRDRPIAIVYPGDEQRAALILGAKPVTAPWMAELLARVRADSSLTATAEDATPLAHDLPARGGEAGGPAFLTVAGNASHQPIAFAALGTVGDRETLLVFATVDAGSLASAALIAAVAHAAAPTVPVTEWEPGIIAPDQLHRWERLASPTARPPGTSGVGDADGRWLWMAVLLLLALESWMRRSRPEADSQRQVELRPHERAA